MSLETIKSHFKQLVENPNHSVIALTGAWGTGKTHMWQMVQRDCSGRYITTSSDKLFGDALYVSLFGIKSVAQLKTKIVLSCVSDKRYIHLIKESMSTIKNGFLVVAKYFIPKIAPLNLDAIADLTPILAPFILKETLIVIDDIERKHADLDIDELLGFIDEYKQSYGSRFVLILNSDKLGDDKENWELFREKVIDHEIAMDITSDDAFDIAMDVAFGEEAKNSKEDRILGCEEAMRRAVGDCGLKNIRVILKVIEIVKMFMAYHPNLTRDVVMKMLAPTTLLAALHFRGVADAPDLDSLLAYEARKREDFMLQFGVAASKTGDQEEAKQSTEISMLMSRMRVAVLDDYAMLVVSYLKAGILDRKKAKEIFDALLRKDAPATAKQKLREFCEHLWWSPEISHEQLLEEARSLEPQVRFLDSYDVTDFSKKVGSIAGGTKLSNRLVELWLADFEVTDHSNFITPEIAGRQLHPAILEKFKSIVHNSLPRLSLVDACFKVASSGGWGEQEKNVLKNASSLDFEAELRKLTGDQFRWFIAKNVEFLSQKKQWEPHFGPAMDNFLGACRRICDVDPSSRLSGIIRREFEDAGMMPLLA